MFRSTDRRTLGLSVFVIAFLLLSLVVSGTASADGAPYSETGGYPKYGCYDIATAGIGMWGGGSTYQQTVNVPGPVVDAYLYWIGPMDSDAPNAPQQSDLVFNGTGVVGEKTDQMVYPYTNPDWYMWQANIGPSGYNLIHEGANPFTVTGWATSLAYGGQNGVSVVVVYSTGACERAKQIDLVNSSDWYWELAEGRQTTDPIVFHFPPLPVKEEITVWLHHAGTDQWNPCRPENIWAASGNGAVSTNFIQYGSPSTGLYGGTLVVENGFTNSSCEDTKTHWPVVGLVGWDRYNGPTPNTGGNISPEWSIIQIKVEVPAGSTWLALQAESVKTGVMDSAAAAVGDGVDAAQYEMVAPNTDPIHRTGESGAWFAQAVIPLYEPELRVTKTDNVTLAAPGDTLTYVIGYDNHGNGPAEDATIVDKLPARATFVSASNGGMYDGASNSVTWDLGKLDNGKSGQVELKVKLDPVFPAGTTTLTNQVAISTSTEGELDTSDNEATDTTDVFAKVELSIAKIAAPEPVEAGANLTYTVTWTVGGNAYAPGVQIVDALPDGVTPVDTAGGQYDPAAGTITWNLGEVTPVQNGEAKVVVQVNSPQYNGTKLTNEVTISDTIGDQASASVVSTVHSDHELSIEKVGVPDPVAKGAELTYTIEWGVTGNEPADELVIMDTMPFGTQFVSASDGGLYDVATRTVTWELGDKVPGDEGSLTLVVKVNKDFPNRLDISNIARISDFKPGEEKQAEAITKVVQTPEGSIGDTVWYDSDGNGKQEPAEPGIADVQLMLYGAGADQICSADDVLLDSTVTDGNGKYRFGELAAGIYCVKVDETTVPAGLVLTTGANPHGPINLTEGKAYRDADFGYGPRSGTAVIGDRIWSDANGDGIQDAGEVGIGGVTLDLLAVGADGLCGTADDSVLATKTTSATGTYLFTGLAAGAYCVKVTDIAGVLAGLTLTTPPNPRGPIEVVADGEFLDADFGYQGLAGRIGDFIFYDGNRSSVYDGAPLDRGIGGVTLSLIVPGSDDQFGTSDDAVVATTITDGAGNYQFNGLPDGRYLVMVTDLFGRLVGYTQTYGLPDTNNNGQVNPYPATITGGGAVLTADFAYADGHILALSKSNDVPLGHAVEAGANMVYTIAYATNGREPAPGVVIQDPLPLEVGFISASDGGQYDPATRVVTWNVGTLDPGGSGSVTVTVKVHKGLDNGSYIFNTATITDAAGVRDEASNAIRVHAVPILSLSKANTPTGEVKAGDIIKYQLCYSNTGNGNSHNTILTDPIPVYTGYVVGSATGGGVYDAGAGTLTWNLGLVAPDVSACVGFDVKVGGTPSATAAPLSFADWVAPLIVNTATLSCTELPDVAATVNNPLYVTLAIYKSVDKAKVVPQESLLFTVSVSNPGPATTTGVVVTDLIGPRLENPVFSVSQGTVTFDPVTRLLTADLGTLVPGQTATINIRGRALRVGKGDLPYQITNMATVSFGEGPSRESNVVTVDVVAPPSEIPEPGTWLLLGSGLAGLAGYAKMRMRARRKPE